MQYFKVSIGFILTIIIAIIGFSAYSSGDRYMTYFGIKLSQTAFTFLIIAFFAIDAFSAYRTFKNEKRRNETIEKTQKRAANSMRLEGRPCVITIKRLPNFVGKFAPIKVLLNGVEQGVVKNGKTVSLETEIVQNEIMVFDSSGNVSESLTFKAVSGGNVNITIKYLGSSISIVDDVA